MRKIREVLRLTFDLNLAQRAVGQSCDISASTVGDYLARFKVSGLPWPLPEDMTDDILEDHLFRLLPVAGKRPVPDWEKVHKELRRKHVTLSLLWQEYRSVNPDGYEYSWFCETYDKWRSQLEPVMRQEHKLGEKCFVDYAGDTVPVVWDADTGEVRQAQIFIGVLGASNYCYAEASWSQDLKSWIGAHSRMFRAFHGSPRIVVCDNLKSGVTKPDYYEPDVNPTYLKMAKHYGVAVLPTRVAKPRDKAKVEGGVKIVEQSVLAPLREVVFSSLAELNERIAELVFNLNDRPFQKLHGSRRLIFEEQERNTLRPLPDEPFLMGEWKLARVHVDYHIEIDGSYYSVPYRLIGQQVEAFLTCATVEIFDKGVRVAAHARSSQRGSATTVKEHMPPRHRHVADWNPERIVSWASKTGPAAETMVRTIMGRRLHPEQGFRACLGILRLAEKYTPERLEAACRRAAAGRAFSCKSVRLILEKELDKQSLPASLTEVTKPPVYHENIRGAQYYQQGDMAI